MVGMIPAVNTNSNAERAAINQTVRVPIGVAGALEDVVPGQLPADTGNTTVGYTDITITKSKAAPVVWNGEQELAIGSTGTYNKVLADQFEDGIRKLVNAIEIDLCLQGIVSASRAYGVAGTAPFATAADLSDVAGVRQILEDNGAPLSDLQLALNSAAMFNLRGKQSVLFKVNEAGSSDMLRNGMTDRLQGFALRNSGGFRLHTKGSGASLQFNGAGAIGDTSVALDTGTGTVLAGDIITAANGTPADSNKYVVNTALAAGSLIIGGPGLRSIHVDNDAVTVGNSYTANLAFARSAIVLAARAPALPKQGDSAIDRMSIKDPFSGLSFEVSVYAGYRQVKYEIAIAWGTAGIKPEHVAILLG